MNMITFVYALFVLGLSNAAPPFSTLPNAMQILQSLALKSANGTSANPRLFVVGGNEGGGMRAVDAFHLPAGTKSEVARLESGRHRHGITSNGGLIYIVGGMEGFTYLATVDVYIPHPIDEWFSTTSMNEPRYGVATCVFDGKIYAIGGQNLNDGILKSVETYDSTTRRWTPIANMTVARYLHAVGVLGDAIYAAGGYGEEPLSSVERYNVTANQWSRVASMGAPRISPSVAVVGGKLYTIGGMADDDVYLKSVEVYSPESDEWTSALDMPEARGRAAAAACGGLIYVVGGQNASARLDSVVVFDPTSNTWNTSSNMRLSSARDSLTAVVL